MSTHSDDAWSRPSFRYNYYSTQPMASQSPAPSSMSMAMPATSTTAYMAQQHRAPIHTTYQPQYEPHHFDAYHPQTQYYSAPPPPLQFRVHAPPTAAPFADAHALPLGDSDFDDMRMLQEMLLTPHPRDEEARSSANLMIDVLTRSTSMPITDRLQPCSPHSEISSCDSHAATKSNPRSPRASLHRSNKDRKVAMTRICRVPDCTKGIRSRGLCKAHGGGRRCQTPGCSISDQGGGHCIAHGGGKRCTTAGCDKSAQYKGLCKVHGGSRQCRVADCQKNGQIKGMCRLHYTLSANEDGDDA